MADRALLLGINEYESVPSLRGCENDVENMYGLLTGTFGFPADGIQRLTSKQVTRAKVEHLMRWLFEGASPGDRRVFHFSGHGSYTVDLDGDEGDGRDELICLYDMDFNDANSYFIDDQLRDWIKTLPGGVQLLVVMDNCHSGTGTRKIQPVGSPLPPRKVPLMDPGATLARAATRGMRSLGPELAGESVRAMAEAAMDPGSADAVLVRFVEPPPEIARRAAAAGMRRSITLGPSLREIDPGMNHVLLAACRDDQTAADATIDGKPCGAFTYHLCRILRDAGPDLARDELTRRLTEGWPRATSPRCRSSRARPKTARSSGGPPSRAGNRRS